MKIIVLNVAGARKGIPAHDACFTAGDANFCWTERMGQLPGRGSAFVSGAATCDRDDPAPVRKHFTALSESRWRGSPGIHKPGVGGAGLAGPFLFTFWGAGHNFSPRGASQSLAPPVPVSFERGELLSRCVTGTPKTPSRLPSVGRGRVAGGDLYASKCIAAHAVGRREGRVEILGTLQFA